MLGMSSRGASFISQSVAGRQLVPLSSGARGAAAGLGAALAAGAALGAGLAAGFGALGATSADLGVAGFGAASAIAFPAAWAVSVTAVLAAAADFLAAVVASAVVASCQARLALAGISGSVACSRSSANLRWMA